ncbi:hypothetical protein BpHYR1_033026 [Brachionus plicatilis]|uniref:Uncharacterized protein n=1 Tax=Brachionus plicatilis TaxID=10195 RepID=A0A3M7PE42_BRAPC|nr:hypothetical protein BpHYR1_033026 [Brachionus plicatilis]
MLALDILNFFNLHCWGPVERPRGRPEKKNGRDRGRPAAKKRPVHLTANDRAWPAKPRPTDGPTK